MKKIISLIMATIMFSIGSNVFSMDTDPIKADDRRKIREYFKKESDSNPGDTHLPIEFPLKRSCSSESDYRAVKVYNMQHLMRFSRERTSFLQAMIDLYVDAQKSVTSAMLAHNSYHGPEVAMDKAITDANAKINSNDIEKAKIRALARETGLTHEEALQSYLIFVGTEAASKAFGSKYGWKVPVGAFGAVGGACLGVFCTVKLIMGVKGAMYISLGIGGLLGGLALVVGGLYIANDYIKEQASKADTMFKIQRMQNVARALKQFGSQIVGEPEAVLNSNVFVTAVDLRKNSDGTGFETNSRFWRWWHSDLRDDKAWCAFDTITDLACAPKAKDYVTHDGRSLRTFVKIFSSMLNAEVIDYARLEEYLRKPAEFERSLTSIAPNVTVVSEVEADDDYE